MANAVWIQAIGLDENLPTHGLETAPGFRGVTAGALTSRSAILSVGAGLASLVTHRSPVAPARGKRHLRISLTGKAQKPSPVSTCGVCAAPEIHSRLRPLLTASSLQPPRSLHGVNAYRLSVSPVEKALRFSLHPFQSSERIQESVKKDKDLSSYQPRAKKMSTGLGHAAGLG